MANLLREDASGVYIIAATPFKSNGTIDYNSVDSLLEFYLDKGVTGITILGMMGEANKMSIEEAKEFMGYAVKRISGRVPIVVGISDPGISNLANLAKSSMDVGCSGVMIAPPNGLKTEENIYKYFTTVFESLGDGVPVCYQDYPQSTDVFISVDCFNRLVRHFDQLVMFKHEDCPGLSKLSQIRSAAETDDTLRRVSILVGNGGLYLPEELSRGADGAMTGFSFPEMVVEVVKLFSAGSVEVAKDIFDAYMPLVRYEQQPGFGLAVRKEILRRRGAIKNAETRTPGPSLTNIDHEELSALLSRLQDRLETMG